MTMFTGKVSINILHYNSFEKTKKCLQSCLTQKGTDVEIIIIDNHSTNDSLDRLKTYFKNYDIIYLENQDNFGFAKGNNIGVKYAIEHGIDYSLLLNNDTELIGEGLLTEMLCIMKEISGCSIVAPLIFDVTRNGLVLLKNDSIYLKLLRMVKVLPQNKKISDNLVTISEAQGSALLVDNKQFLNVGGFPEHYFMYGEEGTLSKKIIWNSGSIIWDKNKGNYVLHHHDKAAKIDEWRLYLMGRNRAIEYMENRNRSLVPWSILYRFFYLYMSIKNEKEYLKGMKEGIRSIREKYSKKEIFEAAQRYVSENK